MNTTYSVHTENAHKHIGSCVKDKREIIDKMAKGDLPRTPQMTGEQYESILQILDKDSSQSGIITNMADMTGITQIPLSKVEGQKWIIDSGATNHMISSLDILSDVRLVKSYHNKRVHLPNGGVTLVTHTGSCKITKTGEIHDVLFVPDF